MQILQKPNDLDLNLKYAQQQGKIGNYKQTISTLERLNMLYPDNVEIKLYLLSVLVQADSPNKALTIIEEIKTSEDLTPEDLETVNEIEAELKERGRPKLWNFYADISLGGIYIVKMLIVFQKQDYKVVMMRSLDLIVQSMIKRIVRA